MSLAPWTALCPISSCPPWLLHCLLIEVQINPTFPLLAGPGRKDRCCRAPSLLCPHFPTPRGQVTPWSSPGEMTPVGCSVEVAEEVRSGDSCDSTQSGHAGDGAGHWLHPGPGAASPVLCRAPRGQEEHRASPGDGDQGGTVLRRLRLPPPGYKGGGGGGGCSRHRPRAPRAAGHRECVSVARHRGRGERDAFTSGDVPSFCLSHFHPPMGVPHPWVLGTGVPAPSQHCAEPSQALPSPVWDGWGGFQMNPISLRVPLATLRDRN